MITDVRHSVNMYIRFCVKRFEPSHVMDIRLQKCYVLLLCNIDSAVMVTNVPVFADLRNNEENVAH